MAENILESYFIKVGALPDMNSFKELGKQFIATGASVEKFSANTALQLSKLEYTIVKTFATWSGNLVGLANRTAMADQSYRLFGLRMLMTKESARAMSQALDQLGATINEVAYDPELNKRFQYLYEYNIKLARQLGGDFDDIMYKMRDVRMEVMKFSTEVEVGLWGVMAQTFKKLGYDQDDFIKKLEGINKWIFDNLPKWIDEISDDLAPAWKDFEIILGDVWDDLKKLTTEYIKFSGFVSGDDSLEKGTISMKNIADATLVWVDALAKLALGLELVAKMYVRTFGVFFHGGMALSYIASGQLFKAGEQAKEFWDDARTQGLNVAGMWTGNRTIQDMTPDYQHINQFADTLDAREKKRIDDQKEAEEIRRETERQSLGISQEEYNRMHPLPGSGKPVTGGYHFSVGAFSIPGISRGGSSGSSLMTPRTDTTGASSVTGGGGQYADWILQYSKKFGAPPSLVESILRNESEFNPVAQGRDASGNLSGAIGMGQFLKKTGDAYEVTDRNNPELSIRGTAHLMHDLLKQDKGDVVKALFDYNAGSGLMAQFKVMNTMLDSYNIAGKKFGEDPTVDRAMARAAGIGEFKDDESFNKFEETVQSLAKEKEKGFKFPNYPSPEVFQDYVFKVLRDWGTLSGREQADRIVTINGGITINIPKNTNEKDWRTFSKEFIDDVIAARTKRTMAKTAGGPHAR